MPELLEVEASRQLLDARGIGREIVTVEATDHWYLKGGLDCSSLRDALLGSSVASARRHGKVLVADLSTGPTLAIRFGMTGRLVIDGHTAIARLVYGSSRDEAAWDRLIVGFDDGGHLRVRDPRRLGGILLEPDLSRLGPDAATVSEARLEEIVGSSRSAIKALLLDQHRIAGLGNLLVDELLWRAGIDPSRQAKELDPEELHRLHRALRTTLRVLARRGGSHTGDLQVQRRDGGICPRDGQLLQRRTIGGRTTWWCPTHQH